MKLGKRRSAGWVEVSISEDQIIDVLTQQIVIEKLEHTCAVVVQELNGPIRETEMVSPPPHRTGG